MSDGPAEGSAPFYTDGLRFSCRRCSRCCGHEPGFVYLSQEDLLRLCGFFRLPVRDFVQSYCRWADYYYGTKVLALKEKPNYDCVLWDNGCTAYPARPVQCSTYPFWTWMVASRKAWDECSADCPGMNHGPLWTAAQIAECSRRYIQNSPLRREDAIRLM